MQAGQHPRTLNTAGEIGAAQVASSAGRSMSEIVRPFVFILIAVIAGMSFVAQQAVNANLRTSIDSAAWAGFVSYLGGTICMAMLALILRDPWPAGALLARSNWWA